MLLKVEVYYFKVTSILERVCDVEESAIMIEEYDRLSTSKIVCF